MYMTLDKIPLYDIKISDLILECVQRFLFIDGNYFLLYTKLLYIFILHNTGCQNTDYVKCLSKRTTLSKYKLFPHCTEKFAR